ncbi:MAG: hypothetical protein ABIF40_03390 [archaeon]
MGQLDGFELTLLTTGALGDLVMTSAMLPMLRAEGTTDINIIGRGFSKGLTEGLGYSRFLELGEQEKKGDFFDEWDKVEVNGKNRVRTEFLDLGVYLQNHVHLKPLPDRSGCTHLVDHMRFQLENEIDRLYGKEVNLGTKTTDVKVALSEEEIDWAHGIYIQTLLQKGYPEFEKVVVISRQSANPFPGELEYSNRDLRMEDAVHLAKLVSEYAIPVQIIAPGEELIEGTVQVSDRDLRKVTALLATADGMIGVDSGPWHMGIAGIQGGNFGKYQKPSLSTRIALAISSNPYSNMYSETRSLVAEPNCPMVTEDGFGKCGAHGYHPASEVTQAGRELGLIKTNRKIQDDTNCIYKRGDEKLFDCVRDMGEGVEAIAEAMKNQLYNKGCGCGCK